MLQVCAVDFTAFHLLRPLLHACRDDGWLVEFACADGPWAHRLRDEGFPHRAIAMTRAASPPRQLEAAAQLARSLRRNAPDLVHTHTPVGGLVGRTAALAWRGPVVHTFHGLPLEGPARSLTEQMFLMAERVLSRRTTHFLSQARGDVARAVALGIARQDDTTVIGNGVDLAKFASDPAERSALRRSLGIGDDDIAILLVARLVREKGVLELADAALALASDPRIHVLVAGAPLASDRTGVGEDLDHHPVVATLGVRWHRLGHRDDVPALMRASDIFVLPTYREGLPRSVIEAMASGLPIVTTDIPACRELIQSGETGILVPPRDATALGGALAALASDPTRRRAFGTRAREVARAEHDERAVLARQVEVLRALARS